MPKRAIFKATLIAAGAAAAIGVPAVSASAATARPTVNVQEQVYHGHPSTSAK